MFCWFFRFLISNASDADERVGMVTRRHALRCADCLQFHRTCRTLAKGLRAEAVVLSPASRRLTREVLTSLPRVRHRPRARPAWTTVAAAACFVMAVLFALASRRSGPPGPPAPFPRAISTPRMQLPHVWTRVLETPLTTEIRNLSNDAQSGIRFLVACVDVRPAEALAPPGIE